MNVKITNHIVGISIGYLIFLGLIFYWFFYRSTSIVRTCSFEAKEKAVEKLRDEGNSDNKFREDDRDAYYKWCLQEKGLFLDSM